MKIEVEKPMMEEICDFLDSKRALSANQIQKAEQFFAERSDGELENES